MVDYSYTMGGGEVKRPMIAAAITSVCISVLALNASPWVLAAMLLITALLMFLCIFVKKLRSIIAVFAVALVILFNAVFICGQKIAAINNIQSDETVVVSGTVTSEYYFDGRAVFTLKTDGDNTAVPPNTSISVYTTFAALKKGEIVKCNMYVRPVTEEYRVLNYSKGIYAQATVGSVISKEESVSLTGVLADFQRNVTDRLYRYLSPESAATVNALSVGDKYYLTDEFDTLVQRSGVSHIMVVSGMHMAIICGTLLKLLERLQLGKRLSAVITAMVVFLFMAQCGFSMSVMRAGITYFIMLASLVFIRRTDPLNSLCVAVCIIIMLNPFSVGSVAFMLSCSSTAGIIILSGPMARKTKELLPFNVSFISAIIDVVSVTLSALIFTFPFTVYYFGAVSTVVIITNLLIGYAVTVALISAVAALPTALIFDFSILSKVLFSVTEYVTRYINLVISYFGSMPEAYIKVDKAITLISYLAIILSFVIIKYIDNIISVVKKSVGSIRAGIKG